MKHFGSSNPRNLTECTMLFYSEKINQTETFSNTLQGMWEEYFFVMFVF